MSQMLDDEGFLLRLEDWNPQVAAEVASLAGITLTPAHWEVIEEARSFYEEFGLSPINRVLVKRIALRYGTQKGNSIYLLKLFPNGPAKLVSKIAGLPKPDNCL
jgi:tRNA 2-thiouridine synthesizing protein E